MIMRGNKMALYLYPLLFLAIVGILIATPVGSQYSGFTLLPPNVALGYGGLYNPYVFLPGRYAAANTLSSFGIGGIGLGNPLLGLTGTFNPLFNFGIRPFGSLTFLGLNTFNPFVPYAATAGLNSSIGITSGIGLTGGISAPVRVAAQAGTWLGTWQSTYIAFPILWNTGPMFLNIAEDPLLGTIIGTAIMQDSRYASIPFDVSGIIANDTITLEGFLGTGYDCVLTCILTSPTTMTGFYTVLGTSIPVMDEGVFTLSLNPPVL